MASFSVEQFITDDIEFSSREEAIGQLQKTADKYNGKHIAYGILNPGKQSPRLAFDAISTYSEDWLQRYFSQNYHLVDPVIRRVANSSAPFDWDAKKHITKQEQSFFGESVEHGLGRQGFAIPIFGPEGEVCALSFNADVSDKDWLELRDEILPHLFLFAYQFNALALNIRKPQQKRANLSMREHEVLKWAAEGKSVWETAQILSISDHSVKSYLQNSQRKLQCSNKLHTVVTAVRQGLI